MPKLEITCELTVTLRELGLLRQVLGEIFDKEDVTGTLKEMGVQGDFDIGVLQDLYREIGSKI